MSGLENGFEYSLPLDEQALAMPGGAAPSAHTFERRLVLSGQRQNGELQVLHGTLEPEDAYLPDCDFEFVHSQDYLIPRQRGAIVTSHPKWNYIIEPGRTWQDPGDGGLSRALIPFTLVVHVQQQTVYRFRTYPHFRIW